MNINALWQYTWPLYLTCFGLGFLCLEGYALYSGNTTLSEWTRNLSAEYPVVPFVFGTFLGLLAGHFWRW